MLVLIASYRSPLLTRQDCDLLHEQFKGQTVIIAAPVAIYKKGEFVDELDKFFKEGYYRFIIDGKQHNFNSLEDIYLLKA